MVLIVLPLLLLQEEIELHGNAVGPGLILRDEIGHLLIHVVAARDIALHITAEERQVHFPSLQLTLLEKALVDEMLAHGVVDDPHRVDVV